MIQGTGRTILLVEDEVIIAMSEKMQLEKYGYTVSITTSGEKAVEKVDASADIDLILMDIDLGKGMDGTEAAGIILKNQDIPIVFVSSHTEPEIVEKTEKITSYGYVVKNSSITVLDASIKMAFKLFETKKKEIEKEKALIQSEQKYRLISENTSDGIVHFAADGRIDYVSPAYLQQLGYTESQEKGKGYETIFPEIHPEDREALFSSIYAAIAKQEKELTYTYRVRHAQGHYIWREDHSSFMYDPSGTYLGAYVSCRDITDRKKLEDRLMVLAKAMDASPAIIIITDTEGTIEYVNPRFSCVTGYSNEEVIGKNPRILKSGMTDRNVYIDLWITLTSGKEWKGHFRNRKKSGDFYYEAATIAPVKNHEGVTTNYIAIKEDLTEKRYLQESLEESTIRFNTLAGSQSVLIWESGIDKRCTYFNPTWLAFTGRSLEEELGNGWAEGVHPDDLEQCLKIYTSAFDERKEFSMEYRLRKADGAYGWVLDHGSPKYHNHEFLGYIGSCVDISRAKNYEMNLRESEEKYRLLHESAGIGIGYYTVDGIVLSYNKLAARHMGGTPDDFIGKSIYELFPKADADAYSARIRKAANSETPDVYEDMVPLPSGSKYFLSTYTRISDNYSNILGVQIISQDITERKLMEEALRESKEKAGTIQL
jgi:PAS domain S-box-containing protein